jgi:hypothetical protein
MKSEWLSASDDASRVLMPDFSIPAIFRHQLQSIDRQIIDRQTIEVGPSSKLPVTTFPREEFVAQCAVFLRRMGYTDGLDETKKRGKEKHKKGGICGETKTHDCTFAKIGAHSAGQERIVSS